MKCLTPRYAIPGEMSHNIVELMQGELIGIDDSVERNILVVNHISTSLSGQAISSNIVSSFHRAAKLATYAATPRIEVQTARVRFAAVLLRNNYCKTVRQINNKSNKMEPGLYKTRSDTLRRCSNIYDVRIHVF